MIDNLTKLSNLLGELDELLTLIKSVAGEDTEAWALVRERYEKATSEFNDAAAAELAKRSKT